jgi:hypothetical protein
MIKCPNLRIYRVEEVVEGQTKDTEVTEWNYKRKFTKYWETAFL